MTVIATDLVAKAFGDLNLGDKFLRLSMLRNPNGPALFEKHEPVEGTEGTNCHSVWPVIRSEHLADCVLGSELVIPVR